MVERKLREIERAPSGELGDALPPPPERRLAQINLGIGLATLMVGVLPMFLGASAPSGAFIILSGLLNLWVGLRTRHDGDALQRLRAAIDRHTTGRREEARALLAEARARSQRAVVRRLTLLVEANFALAERDPVRAAEIATTALDRSGRARFGSWSRAIGHGAWTTEASLLGVRALARALAGDGEGARADIATLEQHLRAERATEAALQLSPIGGSRSLEEAIARARLAEAIVLARAADRAGLSAHLERYRPLIVGELGPDERALVRGFDHMLASGAPSPYRARQESTAGSDGWADEVLDRIAAGEDERRAVIAPRALEEASGKLGETSRRDWSSVKRMAAGVGFGVIVAISVGVLVGVQRETHAFNGPTLAALLLAPIVGFLAWILATGRKASTKRRELVAERIRLAESRSASSAGALDGQSRSAEPLVQGQANLLLAQAANAEGAFAVALERAERGLMPLQSRTLRAVAAAVLIPALVTERAIARAALGRTKEALEDVARIPEGVSFRSRSIESVRLVAAVARGDDEEAARIAEAIVRSSLAVEPRVETLASVVLAVARSGLAGLGEMQRLHRELAEGAPARAWITAVSPRLVRAFDALDSEGSEASTSADVDAHHEADLEAEAEAERAAEDEALEEHAPRVLSRGL